MTNPRLDLPRQALPKFNIKITFQMHFLSSWSLLCNIFLTILREIGDRQCAKRSTSVLFGLFLLFLGLASFCVGSASYSEH